MLPFFASAAFGYPMVAEVDWGPNCRPIPSGEDRWWSEGDPAVDPVLVSVDTTLHPLALCNDGTAATYYVRPGTEDRWIVHLQGGGACQDADQCAARWCYTPDSDYSAEMMSSDNSFGALKTGGIFEPDPERNRFASFHHVFVHYCSSDFFLGRTPDVDLDYPAVPSLGYRVHFLGQDILDAVLTELREGRPELSAAGMPSLDAAELVLLTGTTAGAVGVIHNLDRVAALLATTNPAVEVRGVVDSAAYPAADTAVGAPYSGQSDPYTLPWYQALGANTALFGGELDASCVAAEVAEPWWCTERMRVLTLHVATPFFAYSDQLDVENPLCQGNPLCIPDFIAQFEAFDRIADAAVPYRAFPPVYPEPAPAPGYLLPRCRTHAVLAWRDSTNFFDLKIPVGAYVPAASTWVSLHEALWSWVEGDGGITAAVREMDAGTPDCPDPPPPAPTGLAAAVDEVAQTVTLTWTHAPFAMSETVYHSDGGAPPTTASTAFAPVTAPTLVDAGPFVDPERCYAVAGSNAEGEGPLSDAVCATLTWVDDPTTTDTRDGATVERPPEAGCGCASAARPWPVLLGLFPLALSRRRRAAALLLAGCAGGDLVVPPTPTTDSVPVGPVPPGNVLLVVVDDLGIDRLDLYDNTASAAWPAPPTPTIDALAAAGLTFDTAYAEPSCSPARATLLTGKYPRDTGIGYPYCQDLPPDDALSFDHTTLPELLRPAGYTSVVLGKWHLASRESYATNPMEHGFDSHKGTVCTFTEDAYDGRPQSWYRYEKNEDGALSWKEAYATVDTTDDAVEALRTLPEPWFVLLAYNAAHAPWVAPPDELYTRPTVVDGVSTRLEVFDAMVEAMDTELGRVMTELDSSDLADRTTVVLTSDNGTPHPVADTLWLATGGKFTVYESGVRVPLVVRSPLVPEDRRGTRTAALAHLSDLLPTVAELGGVGDAAVAVEGVRGRSLVPFLRAPEAADDLPHLYAEAFEPDGPGPYTEFQRGIRDRRYKLVVVDDPLGTEVEFYDLQADGNPVGWEGTDLLALDPDGLPDDPEARAAFDALSLALETTYGLDHNGGLVPR